MILAATGHAPSITPMLQTRHKDVTLLKISRLQKFTTDSAMEQDRKMETAELCRLSMLTAQQIFFDLFSTATYCQFIFARYMSNGIRYS